MSTRCYVKDSWRRQRQPDTQPRASGSSGRRPTSRRSRKPASPQFPQLFPAGRLRQGRPADLAPIPAAVGVSWSLNSRTVIKALGGLYNYLYNDADAGLYNLNALTTIRYRWRDTDGNRDYTPGEVNLDCGQSRLHLADRRQHQHLQSRPEAADDHRGHRSASSASWPPTSACGSATCSGTAATRSATPARTCCGRTMPTRSPSSAPIPAPTA